MDHHYVEKIISSGEAHSILTNMSVSKIVELGSWKTLMKKYVLSKSDLQCGAVFGLEGS